MDLQTLEKIEEDFKSKFSKAYIKGLVNLSPYDKAFDIMEGAFEDFFSDKIKEVLNKKITSLIDEWLNLTNDAVISGPYYCSISELKDIVHIWEEKIKKHKTEWPKHVISSSQKEPRTFTFQIIFPDPNRKRCLEEELEENQREYHKYFKREYSEREHKKKTKEDEINEKNDNEHKRYLNDIYRFSLHILGRGCGCDTCS